MKKTLLTLALAATTSLNLFASEAGGAGPGGGDVDSGKNFMISLGYGNSVRPIDQNFYLQIEREITPALVYFLELHTLLDISHPSYKMAQFIEKLNAMGLTEEIQNAKYELKDKCFEKVILENGSFKTIETDASTLKGQRGALICLSTSRLTSKNYSTADLAGLIMHENVRHFLDKDKNDTLYIYLKNNKDIFSNEVKKYKIHPTALYTSVNINSFISYKKAEILSFDNKQLTFLKKDNVLILTSKNRKNYSYFLNTKSGKKCNILNQKIGLLSDNIKSDQHITSHFNIDILYCGFNFKISNNTTGEWFDLTEKVKTFLTIENKGYNYYFQFGNINSIYRFGDIVHNGINYSPLN